MDEQTLSLIPATEEDLQYLNPEPQSLGLVPATDEDLQYITPEIREPTMQEMTSDFETFKMFRKAGAFDSGKTATEMVTEGVSGMASDLGHWAKTLPMRLASNFLFLDKVSDTYKPLGKVKTKAKATTLQTIGNLELDYKSIGAGISRGVDKVFGDAETEEDLRSSYEFFKTQADLEQQRQGKAAEMVTEGFLGMSPEFLTLGMSEEERQVIRSQQVTPDMKAARGGSLPSDPTNFIPMGAAFKLATGTGRATLKGAEKVLINETLQLAKLQDDMTKALSRVGDNSIKSRRLAIKQAPVKARLEKGLTEVTEKIAENKAKLKPLAAKRDMALTQLASDLPVGNPLKDFLNDALKEVPIKQPLNLTNKVGGAGLIAIGKPIEYLGNALQFIKTLPQETAINMLMKAGDKVGMEVTEQQANALIKSGVMGGVGYGGYSLTGEFTDSELGKLGGAVGALLGPQFLARFGRNTAILGREAMKPASDLPFFTRLASKDAEKMTTQLIDRTALVPVESVARQVTGAAEGKVLSRMGGPQAFGNMSPGGQATVNFLDRSGLGRYVESTGRMAKGVGAGGAVGGAFGLAASGGMDMPEAFYGGIGAGMLFGSAGAVGGEVARFNGPINHMEARYGDLYHYAENYLPAGQKESFNKLNRDVQMAVANKIVANPSLAIEYVSNGKDGEGGYFDRVTGDIVINVDSPRAIEPLLAHEFTHYLEQTGGKRKFIDLLIGNPVIGKPGIFVQRVTQQNKSRYPDLKVGDPIMVGEGANRRFLLSMEFEQARSEYGKKLQDTLLDSDGNKMSDSDLAKIMTDEQTVSEIVAEHGTDFLLNDKRKYRDKNKGTIGKIMGSILDTELVQNIPTLRKTLAMMGGTFRPDGQLITDNKLFSNLKRYPQITELVRKYNNQLEGMSPQKRQAQEASGEIQGGNIKSGGKATKEVVVDIKSAELAKSPQLAELLRAGTLLQIDKDGNVIPNLAMTAREQGKYNRSFAEKMKEAIEEKEANEGLPEGHVRPEVNPKTGKIRFVGRYLDDSVIDKLEKSGNWNKEQIQTLRDVNSNIRNKGGNEYLISYFKAAGQGGGKYVNAKVENHIEVPYGFEITQKNNIILRTVSVNQLVKNVDQLARQQQAELTRLYGADIAQAKVKLLQDLDRYHRNHADGQPGRTGLDADQNIAKAKADFINSAFGSGSKAEAGSNPWRASLGKKNPRDVYRSRRIERIGKMDQLSGTRFIDYDKINKAFIPAYHGTPHTLAPEAGAPLGRFRTSKIGTGEGAQAYGHGLYFAGRREVAEHYRKVLTDGSIKDFVKAYKDKLSKSGQTIEDGVAVLKRNDMLLEARALKASPKELEQLLKGSLYKVELAPKENEYLLYDKTLGEQPKGVQDKLKKFLREQEGEDTWQYRQEQDYRDITNNVLDDMPEAEISKRLKEAGIPGIKYLDGASRSKGEGDFNYVIFDEADVTVTDKLFMPQMDLDLVYKDVGRQIIAPPVEGTKRLYNAGLRKLDPKGYLEPHVSDWVKEVAEGVGDIPASEITKDLIYMSDDPRKWISMIVARGLKKPLQEVTMKDIRDHGRMNVLDIDKGEPAYKVDNYFETQKVTDLDGNPLEFYKTELYDEGDVYTGEGRSTEMPVGPEPDDFISASSMEITHSLIGDDLVNFLHQEEIGKGQDKLFMPASEAGATKGKIPKSGDMLTLDDSSLKLFLPSPSNPNASLSDFKGKNVQVLTADLSVVGDKKADGAMISFTGGPGYLSVNDAWGFTNEAGAKAFKTRWERDGKPLIGITSMKQENHRASTLTREYYVRKFMEAINDGKISENTVNRHIKTALKRAIDGKNGLTNNQKAALKTVKTIEDFLKVFPDKELIPWKATPMIYGKLDAKTLPIKQDRLKKLGLDTDTILRETRQPEYNDIKKGSLLAIAEYDGSGATYRPDLNSAYPWSIPLNEKAFLKDFADIQDLSSRQDLRGSDGEANMAVAMGAGVMLDKLGRGDVNFMPSDPKAPKAQPANRIKQQAPAMPGNRFMAPAASAGAKLSERFR